MGLFGDLFDDVYEDGLHISRWGNRNKRSEGNYKNGKKEGLWTVWYENGLIKYEMTYKDGKPNGRCTNFNNGQKNEEGNLKNGLKEGLWTEWDICGRKTEKHYKNGKLIKSSDNRYSGLIG